MNPLFHTACASPGVTTAQLLACHAKDSSLLSLWQQYPTLKKPNPERLRSDKQWVSENKQHHIVTYFDAHYPALLKHIDTPPPLLYVKGHLSCLQRPQLGIVGARKATPSGQQAAHSWAMHLSLSGLVITSGLALGVDASAHRGALEASGHTLAVLGAGLHCLYPACHRDLATHIASHGALVSEFPLNAPPKPYQFLQRNRIVSGLSLGVLVVEAGMRSGSLTTARLAAEQGRDVFAIPGSPHNLYKKGVHHLIKQGASLVETPEDILEALRITPLVHLQPSVKHSTHPLLKWFSETPVSIETLVRKSQCSQAEVMDGVLELQKVHAIQSVPGGYVLA